MDEYRMARRVLMAEVNGGRVRAKQRLGWMEGVMVALSSSGVTVRLRVNARKIGKSIEPGTYVT